MSIPKILDIKILTPTSRQLQYKYELTTLPIPNNDLDIDDSIDESIEESQFSWNDCCHCRKHGQTFLRKLGEDEIQKVVTAVHRVAS